MTICKYSRSHYCLSACCYKTKKIIVSEEIDEIGLENVVKKNDKHYLKNKEGFWAGGVCTFLDEETCLCDISHNMPYKCQLYTCYGEPGFEEFWQEVRHFRKKRGLLPP
ncbi:YkgJ family cysteine cluster protein [Candidatus Woesearchaeota archaeon]|jgi:Fe-S-cluster containining protein|nr:YkgJ family cysteine cluster protein [Candidatus Woesearchaeota archaeon]MBT5342982.1 YkgJ family cysteine cluster protein [Candidatus Woesearchaeota archaeon]MBT5740619.1 YkgJ family cysteine cluster protein [Candidatus Woesearchaeota archaeon]